MVFQEVIVERQGQITSGSNSGIGHAQTVDFHLRGDDGCQRRHNDRHAGRRQHFVGGWYRYAIVGSRGGHIGQDMQAGQINASGHRQAICAIGSGNGAGLTRVTHVIAVEVQADSGTHDVAIYNGTTEGGWTSDWATTTAS